MNLKKSHNYLLVVFIILIALTFQIIPFFNIFITGPLAWHIQKFRYMEGLLHLSGLGIIAIACLYFLKEKKTLSFILVGILAALFLNHYNSLFSSLLAVVYFEIILSTGNIINKLLFKHHSKIYSFYKSFLTGILFLAFIFILLSILNVGSINNIKSVTYSSGLILILLNKKNLATLIFIKKIKKLSFKETIPMVGIFLVILMQFAKGSVSFDYDSLWYGLRPHQVLIPNNSFFENIGLLQFVYYYPKLMELILLPVSFANEYSFIYAGNTMLFGILAMVIYNFSVLLGANRIYGLLITLAIITIPTVANLASTSKTDIFTTLLLLMSLFLFFKSLHYNNGDVAFAIIALILSTGMKATSYMFMPSMVIAIVILSIRNRARITQYIPHRNDYFLVFLAMLLIFVTYLRTYLITGFPSYPFAVNFWRKIGFVGNFPFNYFEQYTKGIFSLDIKHTLIGFFDYFFNPVDMVHVICSWPGNFTLFLFLLSFFYLFNAKKVKLLYVLLPFLFTFSVFLVLFINKYTRIYGGDGNYLLFPIILISIFLFSIINRNFKLQKVQVLILSFFIFSQFFTTYYTHWSWKAGFEKFYTKDYIFDTEQYLNKYIYDRNKVSNLVKYMNQLDSNTRSIIFDIKDKTHNIENKPFPIITETMRAGILKNGYGISKIGTNDSIMIKYIEDFNIEYLFIHRQLKTHYSYLFIINNFQVEQMLDDYFILKRK